MAEPGTLVYRSQVFLLAVVVMRGVWGETNNSTNLWKTLQSLETTTETGTLFLKEQWINLLYTLLQLYFLFPPCLTLVLRVPESLALILLNRGYGDQRKGSYGAWVGGRLMRLNGTRDNLPLLRLSALIHNYGDVFKRKCL